MFDAVAFGDGDDEPVLAHSRAWLRKLGQLHSMMPPVSAIRLMRDGPIARENSSGLWLLITTVSSIAL